MALAVVIVGSLALAGRLGFRGRDAGRPRAVEGVADDPATSASVGTSTAEESGATSGRADLDEGGDADREKNPRAGEQNGGGGAGRRRGPAKDQVLAFIDEFERQIDAAMARARESVVLLEYTAGHASSQRRRIASGVVINFGGDILSVRIEPPRADSAPAAGSGAAGKKGRSQAPIVAHDYRGRRLNASWVAADPHTGLTLLRVLPRAVRPIRPASDGPKLGSQVFVLGNPFGMGHSVNRGHVAGLERVLDLGQRQLGGLIQVQAPLYPGDSGAAVVDVRGSWLGLIRGGLAIPGTGRPSPVADPGANPRPSKPAPPPGDAIEGESDTDFGFAIPTRDALWIAEQLRVHGRVDRAYLGVRLEMTSVAEGPIAAPEPPAPAPAPGPSSASTTTSGSSGLWRGAPGSIAGGPPEAAPADLDPTPLPSDGARIVEVVGGTPAAQAGLRDGDRIIAVDGQPIRSADDLIDRLDRIPARAAIVLDVVRDGEPARPRFEVIVRTASRSGPPAPRPVPAQGASPGPRSASASVAVTPTSSRIEPAAPAPTPPTSGGSATAAPTSGEARPASGTGDAPAPAPRQDAAPAPSQPPPDRTEPPAPSNPSGSQPSLNELKLTLPKAVVERIEHLERRIDELEQFRAGASAGTGGERATPPQSAAPTRQGEQPGRGPGPSGPDRRGPVRSGAGPFP